MRRFLPLTAVLVAAVLLPCSQLPALEIEGPTEAIEPGEYVQLFVRGLEPADLPKARVVHWPRQRVQVVPAQTWGGGPFIWFGARLPGEYFLCVISGDDYAEAIIRVGEEENPPPPPPPVPVPGERWMLLVHEASQPSTATASLFVQLRISQINGYLASKGHRLTILDQHGKGSQGIANPEIARLMPLLDPPVLPAFFIGEGTEALGDNVLYKGALPATLDDIIALIKEHGG